MSLFTWFSKLFTSPALPSPQPRRRDRAICEFCGKDIAIIASSGRLWRHTCVHAPATTEATDANATARQ